MMEKRPILFVDHANALGGAERLLLSLMQQLANMGWEPHLATVEGELAAAADSLGVETHLVALPQLRRSSQAATVWRRGIADIAKVAGHIDAAILHSNTVRATLYAAFAARRVRKPLIWHFHDFWLSEAKPKRLWPDRLIKLLLCRSATKVIAISNAVQEMLPCASKVTVVHNGLDVSKFVPVREDAVVLRQQLGIAPETAVIGMVGRLRPWKGQETFLHMAHLLHQQQPNSHFLVVGGDPFRVQDGYADRLLRLRAEMGLETAVTFLGQLDDVRPALAAMDVFVHPGDPEPFGLVNIEAMSMGKPVVAFAHGALPEIVVPNETGLLVSPHDRQGIATAVAKLLANPSDAQAMGQRGRERVQAQFTIEKTAVRIESVYNAIVGEKNR